MDTNNQKWRVQTSAKGDRGVLEKRTPHNWEGGSRRGGEGGLLGGGAGVLEEGGLPGCSLEDLSRGEASVEGGTRAGTGPP